VAVYGLTKVAPIITYQTFQIEQKKEEQDKKEETKPKDNTQLVPKAPKYSLSGERFVNDVLGWWTNQVESYQQVMDMIKKQGAKKISFKVLEARERDGETIKSPDFLVVNATDASGKKQTVKVAVNERAMNPTQYIQCKINQGMLYDMAEPERKKVEIAITRYINSGVVGKTPPAYIQSDMSIQDVYEAISFHQAQRVQAIQHIRALNGVIEAALH
jgi:hypothetical protein